MGFFIIVRKCKCTLARAYYMREALGKISTKKIYIIAKGFWMAEIRNENIRTAINYDLLPVFQKKKNIRRNGWFDERSLIYKNISVLAIILFKNSG